jgi:CheY-like chemotaxis protein
MEAIVNWFKSTDWLANALAIFTPIAALVAWFWRRSMLTLAQPRSFSALASRKLSLPYPAGRLKSFAQVAIVDDNLSDFPVQELKRAGYDVKTYKHVAVSDFDEIARFDAVFLDMHDIVKDDPTEGGLKLIKILRLKNPRQKICAVSGNQFNPSATAFFKLADDTQNKPMSAQRCVEVLEAFLAEKLDPKRLADILDASDSLSSELRKQLLSAMQSAARNKSTLADADIPASLPNQIRSTLIDLSRALKS